MILRHLVRLYIYIYIYRYIHLTPHSPNRMAGDKALNELMLDCFKKVRESKNKRKRAMAEEQIVAGAVIEPDADGPGPKRARFEEGRPVTLYIS